MSKGAIQGLTIEFFILNCGWTKALLSISGPMPVYEEKKKKQTLHMHNCNEL